MHTFAQVTNKSKETSTGSPDREETQKLMQDTQKQEELKEKRQTRNREIGLKLGKICYFINYHGLPFTLFAELVKLLGDFNAIAENSVGIWVPPSPR